RSPTRVRDCSSATAASAPTAWGRATRWITSCRSRAAARQSGRMRSWPASPATTARPTGHRTRRGCRFCGCRSLRRTSISTIRCREERPVDEFQILTAFAEILPLTVVIPVLRATFSQVARPRGVASWRDLAFAVALMPVLVFLPGVAADSFVMVSGEFDGGSEAVFETLSVLGLLSAQGTVLRVQKRYTDSAFAPVESKPGMALPAHRARLVGSPGLRDPEGEAELAERHDAVLKAWIASGSAGGERMIELVESASHWSQAPLSPEYRRAIEL